MTMVVSDISCQGILMVGDSAVTIEEGGIRRAVPGAAKVQYSPAANVGFAVWGNASVGPKRFDEWLAEFIADHTHSGDLVLDIAQRLASQLNHVLVKSRTPWVELKRGVHVAGYREGCPVLFHVHCGPEGGPYHELRVHKDYPDDQGWTVGEYDNLLRNGFIHLRNGYYPIFAPLFGQVLPFASHLEQQFRIRFPPPNLSGRLNFYKVLVGFVADVLRVAGEHEGVNNILSSIAFDESGLRVNEQLQIPSIPASPFGNASEPIAKLGSAVEARGAAVGRAPVCICGHMRHGAKRRVSVFLARR